MVIMANNYLVLMVEFVVSFIDGFTNVLFPKNEILSIKDYFEKIVKGHTEFEIPKVSRLYDLNIELQAFLKFRNSIKDMLVDAKLKCRICNEIHSRELMRNHVGKHILNNRVSVNQNTCGFCGLVGCSIELVQSSKKSIFKAKSNCIYYYEFNLKSVSKKTLSKRSPCSNRPTICKNCDDQCYWSYNLQAHYQTVHPFIDVNTAEQDVIPSAAEIHSVLALP